MGAATVCHLLDAPGTPLVVEGAVVERRRLGTAARRFARGLTEQGYPRESCFLLTLRDPLRTVEVALGAWWAGMTVCTPPELLTGLERDVTARTIGVAMQVCDADEIVDEEHIRHRDIPAMSPDELAMAPVAWAPRCTEATRAWLALDGTGEDAVAVGGETHAGLLDRLRITVEGPAGAPPLPAALADPLMALAGAPAEV